MSADLFVKICGITSEADALLSVSLGASAVGFVFAPSPRQVSVHLAGDIAKRLPEHVLTVGVFRDEAPQRVVEAVRLAGLGAAQLHGHETAEETQWVRAACHRDQGLSAVIPPSSASRTSVPTTCCTVKSLRRTGRPDAWRARVRSAADPPKNSTSVSTERQAAPPVT